MDYCLNFLSEALLTLTAVEEDDPSSASSSFRFFLGPMAASAVVLAARFRITSSSSCCSLSGKETIKDSTYLIRFILKTTVKEDLCRNENL